jgi:hypothetical protein
MREAHQSGEHSEMTAVWGRTGTGVMLKGERDWVLAGEEVKKL